MTLFSKPCHNVLGGLLLTLAFAAPAFAGGERINTGSANVAIKGYDPVAYFTEQRPVKGKPAFEHVWQDAKWQFANAEHLEMFASDPDQYAPRYGGFCAGGMSLGQLAPIDPEAWAIVDGRLYLNYSKPGRDRFVDDPVSAIEKADANWEELGRTD